MLWRLPAALLLPLSLAIGVAFQPLEHLLPWEGQNSASWNSLQPAQPRRGQGLHPWKSSQRLDDYTLRNLESSSSQKWTDIGPSPHERRTYAYWKGDDPQLLDFEAQSLNTARSPLLNRGLSHVQNDETPHRQHNFDLHPWSNDKFESMKNDGSELPDETLHQFLELSYALSGRDDPGVWSDTPAEHESPDPTNENTFLQDGEEADMIGDEYPRSKISEATSSSRRWRPEVEDNSSPAWARLRRWTRPSDSLEKPWTGDSISQESTQNSQRQATMEFQTGENENDVDKTDRTPPLPPVANQVLQLRRAVDGWLRDYNSQLQRQRHTTAALAWQMSVNTTPETMQRLAVFGQDLSFDESPPEATEIRRYSELLEPIQARQVALISDRPRYPPSMYPTARALMAELERIFSGATVCDSQRCYHGEPGLQTVMETCRQPRRLLWAWRAWRSAVGPPMRAVYPRLISALNSGARAAGFADMGAVWRQELEMPSVQQLAARLYAQVRPLLQQLHALVRGALRRHYGPELVGRRGPIPAHLLGNLWAQSWESLIDIVSPFPDAGIPDLSQRLRERFSAKDFVKVAEEFYTSLGLPAMTPQFWKNSVFQRPRDGRNMTCHASSADFYSGDDFRILMCLERNERDFAVLHHEMGHIQYFMAYSHLPTVLRDGANSAFHEAVGDTFFYSIFSPTHLHRLGLIDRPTNSSEQTLHLLLQRALAKVPLTGFSLALDRWRWRVYAGHVTPPYYNAAWWQLRETLSGVRHPDCTAAEMRAGCHRDGMDPGAKFHVADNIPHIRYFLAVFLQLQFFEGLCEATYGSPLPMPLHQCDLYGSRPAGQRLRAMMALGKSRSWQDALEVVTGSREISAKPLLRYFRPLLSWLQAENARNREPVGWD